MPTMSASVARPAAACTESNLIITTIIIITINNKTRFLFPQRKETRGREREREREKMVRDV